MPETAKKLTITDGKNTGKNPSVTSLKRAQTRRIMTAAGPPPRELRPDTPKGRQAPVRNQRTRRILELLMLLAAVGVAYVGQILGQTSLFWLAAGLIAALGAAHLQQRVQPGHHPAPNPTPRANDDVHADSVTATTAPRRMNGWHIAGVILLLGIVALGALGVLTHSWDEFFPVMPSHNDAINSVVAFTGVLALISALSVGSGISRSVTAAGITAAAVTGVVTGAAFGVAVTFAVAFGTTVFKTWMATVFARWVSLAVIAVIAVILAMATEWLSRKNRFPIGR